MLIKFCIDSELVFNKIVTNNRTLFMYTTGMRIDIVSRDSILNHENMFECFFLHKHLIQLHLSSIDVDPNFQQKQWQELSDKKTSKDNKRRKESFYGAANERIIDTQLIIEHCKHLEKVFLDFCYHYGQNVKTLTFIIIK